jgi:two-component system KDP operon response regulator KdpE
MTERWTRRTLLAAGGVLAALTVASGVVWTLESWLGLTDASPSYLLAVVAVAVVFGTWPAVVTSIGSFAAYNFLFTHPRFTFEVADIGQLLNLILLLVVGVVVGQLAGAQRSRARSAEAREREARALFEVSRSLATSSPLPALRPVMATLVAEARLEAAWVAVGGSPGAERPVTDAPPGAPSTGAAHLVLQRGATPDGSRWMAVRPPGSTPRHARSDVQAYRVPLDVAGRSMGGLWALRSSSRGEPSREETRILAAAADQIGQALETDRLRGEATSAEVARRSEHMKSVLLESVSHDLRTPLAAIRAAAGTLMDVPGVAPNDLAEVARSIDSEAARMDRLVANLLEMSRIEAGGVTVDLQTYALDDLLAETLRRSARDDQAVVQVEIRRPALRAGRRHAAGPGAVQRRRECASPRGRCSDPGCRDDGSGPRPAGGGGWRAGSAWRLRAAPVREVLPRAGWRAPRHARGRAGAGGVPRAGRGHGRPDRGRSEPHGWPDDQHLAADRRAAAAGSGGTLMVARVLVVEDDPQTLRGIVRSLLHHGYQADAAASGDEAMRQWEARRPDVILLDLGLPDLDGGSIIRRVRRDATTPIIVVSARDRETDRVEALEAGADDYLTKPFGMRELHARIEAVLRRAMGPSSDREGVFRVGPLSMDAPRHEVRVHGRTLALTPREFELLKVLLAHAGRVVTTGRLLRAVWGNAYDRENHYLHVYVAQIRRKLAAADPEGSLVDLLITEPGVGYRVRVLDPAES